MKAFTIRIPVELADRIEEQAKFCHRTRNQQIRYLLERAVPRPDIATGPEDKNEIESAKICFA